MGPTRKSVTPDSGQTELTGQMAPKEKEHKMATKTRKSNGHGYTYKVGNSWKTVISSQGRTVTATAKTQQESRRRAKEKAQQLPVVNHGRILGSNKVTLNDFLLPWLDLNHKNSIASTTYRRYRGLAVNVILPALGAIQLNRITKREISNLMTSMAARNLGPRSQNQTLSLISKCMVLR